MSSWLLSKHSRIGGSQLVEDGVMRQHLAEKAGRNATMAADRMWSVFVEKEVLREKHHYKEVEWSSQPSAPNVRMPGSVHKGSLKEAVGRLPELAQVPGPGSWAKDTMCAVTMQKASP